MKKTSTKRTEHWTKCQCVDPATCLVCKGTGAFLSGITVETYVEEYPDPIEREQFEVTEAEIITPEIGNANDV